MYVPDIAVGRLAETPSDIVKMIDAFLASGGVVTMPISSPATDSASTLAAGYDFMQDAATEAHAVFGRAGLPPNSRTLLLPPFDADDLQGELVENDLAMAAVHADHFTYGTPAGPLLADALCAAPPDADGALVYAVACHAGLTFPGGDCAAGLTRPIDENPQSLDWPQVWAGQGKTYVASTAWAYGGTVQLAYLEELLTMFAERLLAGGGIAVGDALVAAKRDYYLQQDPADQWDEKTLIATTLFGLPMTRVQVEGTSSGRSAQQAESATLKSRVYAPPEVARSVPGRSRLADDPTLPPGLFREESAWSFPAPDEHVTEEGRYYTYGRPRAEHREPIQPRFRASLGLSVGGLDLKAHGAMFTGGTYQDIEGFDPVIERAGVLGAPRIQEEPPFEAPNWYPAVPASFRRLEVQPWAENVLEGVIDEASLTGYLGQYHSEEETERLYSRLAFDIYYSEERDDFEAPHIVSLEGDDASREITVVVTDTVGVYRVVVTYTEDDGKWKSVDLAWEEETGAWRGPLPTPNAVEYIVQAVDEAGNVAVDDNDGQYYRLAGRRYLYLPLVVRN